MTDVKNMAYWLKKNGIVRKADIPGIDHKSEGNTDIKGRSASSALQYGTMSPDPMRQNPTSPVNPATIVPPPPPRYKKKK